MRDKNPLEIIKTPLPRTKLKKSGHWDLNPESYAPHAQMLTNYTMPRFISFFPLPLYI